MTQYLCMEGWKRYLAYQNMISELPNTNDNMAWQKLTHDTYMAFEQHIKSCKKCEEDDVVQLKLEM